MDNMDYEKYLNERLNELNLSELEGVLEYSGSSFEKFSVRDVMDSMLSGDALFDSQVFIENLKDLFLLEIKDSLILASEIITICIIMALLKSISSSFGEKAVSHIAIMVSGALVIALCLVNFKSTYSLCQETINIMAYTMQLLLPLVIPFLISLGGITSGSLLSPIIMGAITIFNTLMQKLVLPALFFSSIFILINSLTDKNYVNKLALFLRGAATFATGLCVTIFSGLTVIQGFASNSADGLLINTARYSINNFVPIVGGFAADSIDMVLSCIGILKNGISIFGVILIILLLLTPLIKLLAIAVIYKVTAIITEPIGLDNISDCLNEMGNSVITMAVVLFLTALMFLIFITVIISIGGVGLSQ